MLRLDAGLAVFVMLSTAALGAPTVKREVDRFSGVDSASWTAETPIASPHRRTERVGLSVHGRTIGSTQTGQIILGVQSDGWAYLSCDHVYWLVDGRPYSISDVDVHRSVLVGGTVLEQFSFSLPLRRLASLSRAESIEFSICGDEMAFGPEHMEGLREVISAAGL